MYIALGFLCFGCALVAYLIVRGSFGKNDL